MSCDVQCARFSPMGLAAFLSLCNPFLCPSPGWKAPPVGNSDFNSKRHLTAVKARCLKLLAKCSIGSGPIERLMSLSFKR